MMTNEKIFLGIAIDDELAATWINQLDQSIQRDSRYTHPGNFHLTLRFVGYVDPLTVSKIQEKIDFLFSKQKTFSFELDKLSRFPDFSSTIIAATGRATETLMTLYHDINSVLVNMKLPDDDRSLRPHVTLCRLHHPEKHTFMFKPIFPTKIEVNEIILYRSEFQPEGSHYHPIKIWKLSAC